MDMRGGSLPRSNASKSSTLARRLSTRHWAPDASLHRLNLRPFLVKLSLNVIFLFIAIWAMLNGTEGVFFEWRVTEVETLAKPIMTNSSDFATLTAPTFYTLSTDGNSNSIPLTNEGWNALAQSHREFSVSIFGFKCFCAVVSIMLLIPSSIQSLQVANLFSTTKPKDRAATREDLRNNRLAWKWVTLKWIFLGPFLFPFYLLVAVGRLPSVCSGQGIGEINDRDGRISLIEALVHIGTGLEVWQTVSLYPLSVLLIFSSNDYFDVIANLVVFQVFAELDDSLAWALISGEGFERALAIYFQFVGGTREADEKEMRIAELLRRLERHEKQLANLDGYEPDKDLFERQEEDEERPAGGETELAVRVDTSPKVGEQI